MTFSCDTAVDSNQDLTLDHQSGQILALSADDNPPPSEVDPDAYSCECEVRIVDVLNLPTPYDGEHALIKIIDPNTDDWTIDGRYSFVNGVEVPTWLNLDNFQFEEYPSRWETIDPLDQATQSPTPDPEGHYYDHMFYMVGPASTAPGFQFNLESRCHTLSNQGVITQTFTRTHEFLWEEGENAGGGAGLHYRAFFIDLSCVEIPQQGGQTRN